MLDFNFSRVHLEVLKQQSFPEKPAQITALLTEWGLSTQTQECVWVISTDANGHLRTVVEVARGAHSEVNVHLPSLLTAVLASGGVVFTVAHNHPTGTALPSTTDGQLNQAIMAAANVCGLIYEEHVIVEPGGKYFSFRDSGLLIPAPRGGGRPLDLKRAASRSRSK